jgi:hypothetical protein
MAIRATDHQTGQENCQELECTSLAQQAAGMMFHCNIAGALRLKESERMLSPRKVNRRWLDMLADMA